MKVLMTTDTVGGVWTYSVQLCRSLAAHGVNVDLATMGAPLSDAQRAQVAPIPGVEVWESAFRLEWMDDPWDDVDRAGDWLLGIERTASPDVIHLNGYAHGTLPWSTPVLMVAHSCVMSWWRAVHGTDAPPIWDRYRDTVRAGLRAAQRVAAPTRAMLNALIEHYGPLPHGIVIPNGCESPFDQAATGMSTASIPGPASGAGPGSAGTEAGATRGAAPRSALLPAGDQPVVLAAARLWDESKNIRSLGAAAGSIHGPVYVAGPDIHPAGGRVHVDGVRALGVLPPDVLRLWCRRASVFAHPARYEPFGLAPLEAAHECCALVLGDIPSLREIWGEAALYVNPDDTAEIAAAVNELLDDPHRCERMASAARDRAQAMTARRMADAYHDAYRTLATRAVVLKGPVACVS